jgi:beta-glucosidase
MPQATFHFPPGFMWGTATAAHQVEGSNSNNNWSAWENIPGRIFQDQKAGLACDWWGGRWKEDLDRAAESGQNAHRLSVEWSRIQPAPDRWDEEALDFYRRVCRGMLERGLTPMVTLHHFTDPLWLSEVGGWENEDTPLKFATYVRRVVEALKEFVSLWITINEPNVYTFSGYVFHDFPPGKTDLDAAFRVTRNLLRGHAAGYRAVHEVQNAAQVGFAHHHRPFRPLLSWSPLDWAVAGIVNRIFNYSFPYALSSGTLSFIYKRVRLPELLHTQDFFGLNYYTTEKLGFTLSSASNFIRRAPPAGLETSESRMISNDPNGFFGALNWANRQGLPVIVTENGIDDASDTIRPRYLVEHIHQIWRAINFNWPVKGYFHWTLVDNFEWERGWSQRFGLWGLDPEKQVRSRRKSAEIYAEICRTNSISSIMVEKLVPQIMPRLFPG